MELVDEDFHRSPLSRPSRLEIAAVDKRYPLIEVGRDIDVRLLLRKAGSGSALDVYIQVENSEGIEPVDAATSIGALQESVREIVVPCKVTAPTSLASMKGFVHWRNLDQSEDRKDFEVLLEGQSSDVDWEHLAREDPYSLEPVSTEERLAGRREILGELIARSTYSSVGSSVIYGQKRVGKTSLAKALAAHVAKTQGEDYKVLYLETGAFRNPDPLVTVENLGRRLCQELRNSDRRLAGLEMPDFRGALAPLDEVLQEASRCASESHTAWNPRAY
jgi:hypothetical protein